MTTVLIWLGGALIVLAILAFVIEGQKPTVASWENLHPGDGFED